jgi:hypothetical protein
VEVVSPAAATDVLRSVELVELEVSLLLLVDGEVEAVVLLELGCCEVVSDEYVEPVPVEPVEPVEVLAELLALVSAEAVEPVVP